MTGLMQINAKKPTFFKKSLFAQLDILKKPGFSPKIYVNPG